MPCTSSVLAGPRRDEQAWQAGCSPDAGHGRRDDPVTEASRRINNLREVDRRKKDKREFMSTATTGQEWRHLRGRVKFLCHAIMGTRA